MRTDFSISFLDQALEYLGDDPTIPSAIGLIGLGDFQEEFASTLYEWKQSDYEEQWHYAMTSLLEGAEKVALMVYYVNPAESINFEWWPMYRVGDMVALQDHMPWYDQFADPFSIERQFDFVSDRRIANEDGQRISEWSVPLESVREFAISKDGFRQADLLTRRLADPLLQPRNHQLRHQSFHRTAQLKDLLYQT